MFTLINSGADILATEIVSITKSFQDLDYQAVYGYAGVYDSLIIDKEVIEFSSMPEDFKGRIQLADPQIHLKVGNSFGVPFGIELLDLEARFKDASMTPIILDPDVNPIIIDAPTIDQVGQSVRGLPQFFWQLVLNFPGHYIVPKHNIISIKERFEVLYPGIRPAPGIYIRELYTNCAAFHPRLKAFITGDDLPGYLSCFWLYAQVLIHQVDSIAEHFCGDS